LNVERFPPAASPAPGQAALEIQLVAGRSTVITSYATNPLKLLTPRSRGPSAWVYTSSFGGGLVAGDQTRLELRLGSSARCFFSTQASTKVYRNPAARPSGHTTRATLEAGSLLVFTPDFVQAFAGSNYTQHQQFHLDPDASLVLLDGLTSGRAARGERWQFRCFQTRNEVFRDGRRLVLDSLRLDPTEGPLDAPHRTGRYHCLASLLLLGPVCRERAREILAEVSQQPIPRRGALVGSASPVDDGVQLRFAGESSEAVGRELHRHLAPLCALLGDDPWARKW
jgi:urease accessory protein